MMHRLEPHTPENGSIARPPLQFHFRRPANISGYGGRHHFLGARRRGPAVPRRAASSTTVRAASCRLPITTATRLFQVDGVPNVRGDVTLLRDGMRVAALNTFGGLAHDKARVLDRFARLLPVGFYYKAFHSKRLFPRWERMFRALTGLGSVTSRVPRASHAEALWILRCAGDRRRAERIWRPRWQRPRPARTWRWWTSRCGSTATVHRRALVRAVQDSPRLPCMPRPLRPATTPIIGWRWRAHAHDENARQGGGVRHGSDRTARGVPQQRFAGRDVGVRRMPAARSAIGVAPGRRVVIVAANLEALFGLPRAVHARRARRRHRRLARRPRDGTPRRPPALRSAFSY